MNNNNQVPQKTQSSYSTNPFTRSFDGLDKLFKHNTPASVIIIVFTALGGALNLIPGESQPAPSNQPDATNMEQFSFAPELIIGILVIALIGLIIFSVINVYIYGFLGFVAHKTIKQERVSFSEAFKTITSRFWTLFVASFISSLKIIGGFLLFVIPGIRAGLRYQMLPLLIFDDENIKARDALSKMKQLTNKRLMEILGITTAGLLIPFIGQLVTLGGEVVLYPQLKSDLANGTKPEKIHWLNYLAFILLPIIVLFILMIALFVVAVSGTQ